MATNLFLQLDSITGGATDENHQDWIEIFSWSHSFDQPTAPVSKSKRTGEAKGNQPVYHDLRSNKVG